MNAALVQLVRERARRRCEYCQLPEGSLPFAFEMDHIIALQHEGPTVQGNLALACMACNNHKGPNLVGIDRLSRKKLTPLFHPRQHKWGWHFRWDGPMLTARTAIGRVTLYVLGINLPHRVEHRQMLIDEGEFPPP